MALVMPLQVTPIQPFPLCRSSILANTGSGKAHPALPYSTMKPITQLPVLPSPSPVPEMPDLYEASIAELQDGMTRGRYTSLQLTSAYLSRIAEVNPTLRCILAINSEALKDAAAADEERAADPTAALRKPRALPCSSAV
jgi:hypothetical protein